jgi:hypothetical protein
LKGGDAVVKSQRDSVPKGEMKGKLQKRKNNLVSI